MPLGQDAKLYVAPSEKDLSASVTDATLKADTDFVETCCKDLNYDLSAGEADGSDRCGGGWKGMIPGLKEFTVTFDIVKKKTSAALPAYYTNLRNAYLNKTIVALMALDGPIGTTGSDGYVANCQVFNFSEDQQLEDVIKNSVTVKYSGETTDPVRQITIPA